MQTLRCRCGLFGALMGRPLVWAAPKKKQSYDLRHALRHRSPCRCPSWVTSDMTFTMSSSRPGWFPCASTGVAGAMAATTGGCCSSRSPPGLKRPRYSSGLAAGFQGEASLRPLSSGAVYVSKAGPSERRSSPPLEGSTPRGRLLNLERGDKDRRQARAGHHGCCLWRRRRGRVEDFVVFVPFVIDGEEVEAEVTEVKQRFARARLLRVLAASPDRVAPFCRHFGACGGCQYQHIAYGRQLAHQAQEQITACSSALGNRRGSDRAGDPCPQPYGYRNRVMIRSQWNKPEQKLTSGLSAGTVGWWRRSTRAASRSLPINEQIRRVRANPPPKGGLKVVSAHSAGSVGGAAGLLFPEQLFPASQACGGRPRDHPRGAARAISSICTAAWGFSGLSWRTGVHRLSAWNTTGGRLNPRGGTPRRAGCANGEFIAAPVEEALPGLVRRFSREQTAVILDPPRKGVRPEVIEWLARERPAQIIYVSCHPATMARD